MSKRFGRNQKRKPKKEIEELKSLHLLAIQALENKLAEKCSQLDKIYDLIPKNCYLSSPKDLHVDFIPGDGKVKLWVNAGDDNFYQEVVHLLKINHHFLNRALHFNASLRGVDVGYALSDAAIDNAPEAFLIETISKKIAQDLFRKLHNKESD